MRREELKVATLLFTGLLLSSVESAAQKKLGVGLFAPEIPFASPSERFRLVQGIAQHLSTVGVSFEARAYKSANDLARDVRTHGIHFAVLGGMYSATEQRARVLAVARVASEEWTIMTRQQTTLTSLKGKVLLMPRLGATTIRFVENGILDGCVDVRKHFRIKMAPDLKSVQTAVRLGQADAAFAPVSSPGLTKVIGGLRIPPPAFVLLDKRLPQAMVHKVTQLMLSYGGVIAGIQGWRDGGRSLYGPVLASSARKTHRMMFAPVRVVRLEDQKLINVNALQPQLPPLEGSLFWIP